jgi:acyl CoA:acetate/3-ketoacid CoA transferase alpha subunit
MSKASKKNKVMSAKEAVQAFVFDGAVVGLGGQNISRCQMALVHEIIRQNKKDLTLVGCNLSIQMDMLVAAGLVKGCECGTGNLERFGSTFAFKRAIENKSITVEDYSHLTMTSRFLAAEMGLPFMATRSLLGSDMLKSRAGSSVKKCVVVEDPWNPDDSVVLLRALSPDVCLVHVQKADEMGNIVIEGITNHEPELIRASQRCIVTCEEIVSSERTRDNPDSVTIPYQHIDAVVEVPFGAYPTYTYRYYTYDTDHIKAYQACAREGGDALKLYLDKYVYGCATFEDYLEKACGVKRLLDLKKAMRHLIG